MQVNTLYFRFRLFHRSGIFGIAKTDILCHLELPFSHTACVHAMDASRHMVVVKTDLVDSLTFTTAMRAMDEHVEAIFQHGKQQSLGFLTGMATHDRM